MLGAPHYEVFAIDPDEAKFALGIFDELDSFLKSTAPYNFYLRFVAGESQIPFRLDRIKSIKSEMTTMDAFEKYLEERAVASDYLREQY